MMIFRYSNKILGLVFAFATQACVNVNLNSEDPQKNKDVEYLAPGRPFFEHKSKHLDKSWQNSTSGSTISYLSDCFSSVDPSLDNIFRGILSEIEDTQIIESHHVDYNAREALHSTVDGHVDGIKTRFELMIFKKNNCTYILTYAAKENAFPLNQRDFLSFVKGFKAP